MTARRKMSLEQRKSLVREWLQEYKSLSEAELNTYASTVRLNDELTEALYTTLLTETAQEDLAPVCHQLLQFYRCNDFIDLKRFAVECIPVLINGYLKALSLRLGGGAIEALLLAIYNQEVVNEDGTPKVKTFTIPSLSKSSVYHDPGVQTPLTLIESSLTQHNQDEHQLVTWGPFPHVERLHSSSRQNVLTYVLYCFNAQISELGIVSHRALCEACISLCQTGFEVLYKLDSEQSGPRVSLSSDLLLEAVSGLYYIMYNTFPELGVQALNAISQRAKYELFNDVIMVTEAVNNSLKIAMDSGERLQLLSTATPQPAFHKAALTNASFKTKKLPDDIPVVSDEEDVTSQVPNDAETSEPRTDRRMSESDKVLMSDKMKMAIKSALKKTEGRMKRESKVKITLHTASNGNDSDTERRMSAGHLTTKDNVELKHYSAEQHRWSSLDEDQSHDHDSVSFSTNRRPTNVPTINTEV